MADGDYIKLSRKILDWEWFTNANTFRVFVYCLLKANWADAKFQGREVPRGTFISSVKKISNDLKLSPMNVRTALNHLISTNELAIETTPEYSVITVNNYDYYQDANKPINNQLTNDQQTTNKRLTNDQQTTNKRLTTIEEYKEYKEEEEYKEQKKEKEENPIKEKVIEKENPKENMEQMYRRVSVEYALSDPLYDKLGEWFKYKQERHQPYKESGMRSLLKKAVNSSHEYGDMEVCDLIDFSMQSNYQGIFWERLQRSSKKTLNDIWRDV